MLLSFLREHTARVMETVRAINTGRTKRSRKIGSHHFQNTSTPKDKSGFHFNPSGIVGESSGESGGAVANSHAGKPVEGTFGNARESIK